MFRELFFYYLSSPNNNTNPIKRSIILFETNIHEIEPLILTEIRLFSRTFSYVFVNVVFDTLFFWMLDKRKNKKQEEDLLKNYNLN